MSITATEIQNIRFGEARRGYNPDEVDEFLERVASDVDTMNRALAEAVTQINDAEERARTAEERLAVAADSGEAPAAVHRSSEGAITEDVISKAFIAAQVSADNLKEEARREAEKLYREAEAKAKDIIRESYNERERILGDIDHLRLISEKFRTEFLSLVNHYATDAQKRFQEFSELVPEGSGKAAQPSVEAMIDANNAAVAASIVLGRPASVASAPTPASAPVQPPVSAPAPPAASASPLEAPAAEKTTAATDQKPADDPGATTVMPAPTAFTLDDDLEIEEID
ncbi:MAG: DivIVA domain-containing protein [Coriobacteriales bacterium]|jgi:cell division initiation protein|nr:DivIVA domain-containing protein [Coriobacteriales bacterium]